VTSLSSALAAGPKARHLVCLPAREVAVTRHRLAALGAALLAALPISLAAQTFQGKIRFRTVQIAVGEDDARPESLFDVAVGALMQREGAEVSEATLSISGKRLRTEGGDEARGAYSIWDIERDMVWLVNPAQRTYMEFPVESQAAAAAPDPALKLRALGQTQRDARRRVRGARGGLRHPRLDDARSPRVDLGVPQGGGRDEGEVDPVEIARALLSRHGFPVLLQVLTSGSLELEETVSVERAPLGDAPFRVPAGFKKQEMPGGP
jgi:hypothetical protein